MQNTTTKATPSGMSILLPLFLAQFICSYAATNMNVAISSIAKDLGTDVHGVQIAITLFTLTMAALMIPGSKLTDIWGRKFCFVLGLIVYGLGALLAAIAQGLGVLIVGYSLLEGIGSALLISPVYTLVTVSFPDMQSRAKSFGIISRDRSRRRTIDWRSHYDVDQLARFVHPASPVCRSDYCAQPSHC